jgi:hypothetical protein
MVERGKGRGLALALLVGAVLAVSGAASANAQTATPQAPFWLFFADTKRTGSIDLLAFGPVGAKVTFSGC